MAWPPVQPSAVVATDVTAQTTRHPDDHNKIAALLALLTPGAWQNVNASGGAAPAFVAPWANYGSVWQSARFRREGGDICRMEGMVGGGAQGATVFTLPIGFRPAQNLRFNVRVDNAGGTTYGALDIASTGVVLCVYVTGSGAFNALPLNVTWVIDPAQL